MLLAPVSDIADHALAKQALEGLVEWKHPHVVEHLREKAGVNEVHVGVLASSNVLVNGKPTGGQRWVESFSLIPGIQVAEEVPGRVHEGVHGVHFPPGRLPALGARRETKALGSRQGGLSSGEELHVLREKDRQVLLWNSYGAAVIAVKDGDRGSPVSLAGKEPVLETVMDREIAEALLLGV